LSLIRSSSRRRSGLSSDRSNDRRGQER
jgi:hypothetical protein